MRSVMMRREMSANISDPTEDLAAATATAKDEACIVVVIKSGIA